MSIKHTVRVGFFKENFIFFLLHWVMIIALCIATTHNVNAQSAIPANQVVANNHTSQADIPATFQADRVDYDDTNHIITWTGNVQVWQQDNIIRADQVTYDRDTGVITARGHVAMVRPNGSVYYAHNAELNDDLQNGAMTHVTAALTDNGKLAANGLRRSEGKINDMRKLVYTACEICEKNKEHPPFWQLKAYGGKQNTEEHDIEFKNAQLQIMGKPILYLPYFDMTDPSAPRKSGFLMPNITPHDRYLGSYFTIPYYFVLDGQSDLTLQGLFATRTDPQLTGIYRRKFNFGNIRIRGAVAYDSHAPFSYTNSFGQRVDSNSHGLQGYFSANGRFSINENWRAGANINLASSADYMRDYRAPGYGNDSLNSIAYIEGFGQGSYARFDGQYYQAMNQGIIHSRDLPMVLPRYTYDYTGQPDAWGGRFSIHTTDFNVKRRNGPSDQRGELQLNWNKPFQSRMGQKFLLTLRLDSMIYRSQNLSKQPLYYDYRNGGAGVSGQILPTIALRTNWPFVRTFFHGHGTQILEPIVQAIYAPNTGIGYNDRLPNEDSFNYEFTDSTLFALNRYQGTDRLDGGLRGNVGVHGNWSWDGHEVDMLVGESFQQHINHNQLPYSGLNHHASDIVMRTRVTPNQFFGLTGRMRLDPYTKRINFGDALFNAGVPHFHVRGGYVYEPITPYYYYATDFRHRTPNDLYTQRTNEISGGFTADWLNWHLSGYTRHSISRHQFVSIGGDVGYSNECFDIDFMYLKQYTHIGGETSGSSYLVTLSLKSLGSFGVE